VHCRFSASEPQVLFSDLGCCLDSVPKYFFFSSRPMLENLW